MRRIALLALAALAVAASAQAAPRGNFVALPSPLAPLSTSPPLAGGATASSEGFRHRVDATTNVDVSLDSDGKPFRVRATQRLDVGVKGDYFFTIGAPAVAVEAAPGSESTPGLRSSSILWAGFNPGRRTLIARATLDPASARQSLPLRVRIASGTVTLVNATGVAASSYTADAVVPPLERYLSQLRGDVERGRRPTSGGAYVTTQPVPTKVRVVAPLLVTGRVGLHVVHGVLEDRPLTIQASGPIRLTVTPQDPVRLLAAPAAAVSGRQLLDRVTRATLTLARVLQYRSFLGDPDPTGHSRTTYVYRTAARPAPPVPAIVHETKRSWPVTLAVAAGIALAFGAAAFAWSRS
jgi:hypothetical protein